MRDWRRGGPATSKLWAGIDIGGTKVATALGDAEGNVVARLRRPTEPSGDSERDIARIVADLRELLGAEGVRAEELGAIGVSVPGPLHPQRGLVLHPPNLPGWGVVPLGDSLREAFDCRIAFENDANASALAEWHFGAGRGHEHLVYLTMSTGIGGGFVLGGRVHRGFASAAGEVGHAPIEWEGEPCVCGMRGCLEAYIGGRAWTARLRASGASESRAAQLAGGVANLTPEHVVEAAGEGDPFSLAELARFNDYLARAITGLVFTLAPTVVVLGTIAAAAGEDLCLRPVREQVRAHVWPHLAEALEILPASLGEDLPFLAGLCVALQPE